MPHHRIISVTGLGYVGLTLVAAFSKVGKVIAFDINSSRIDELKRGHDRNEEIERDELELSNIHFTTNADDLKTANFHIVSIPTPIDRTKHPSLKILFAATEKIGEILKCGDIVVYESSVFPGVTEEKCIPILEHVSKLICGKDFSVGYSPERINPGDKEHTFANITKIISATDQTTLDAMAEVYLAVTEKVHRAPHIKVAEAAKIIENTQRDVNIAFINDIAIMLHSLNIDTKDVLMAMKTKWNHLPFRPGLVGGHCIGVNSYFLLEKAQSAGHYSDIIASGRRVNEYLAEFIVNETIKKMIQLDIPIKNARIGVLGITYKENCSDLRDTQVINIIDALHSYGMKVMIHDPIAAPASAENEYQIELVDWKDLINLDVIILTVLHKEYIRLDKNAFKNKLNNPGLIMDINELFDPDEFRVSGITIWRL